MDMNEKIQANGLHDSNCSLPERFRPKRCNQYKMTALNNDFDKDSLEDVTVSVIIEPETMFTMDSESDDVIKDKNVNTDKCDKNDISQALHWIKDQLVKIKQEDKQLLERFLEIGAKMNKFRAEYINAMNESQNSSASDPSINDSAYEDIDIRASSLREDNYFSEFRARTVSMLPPRTKMSLAVPVSGIKTAEEFL